MLTADLWAASGRCGIWTRVFALWGQQGTTPPTYVIAPSPLGAVFTQHILLSFARYIPFNNFPTLALQMLKAGEWQILDSNHAFEAWKASVLTFIRICQAAGRIDRFPQKGGNVPMNESKVIMQRTSLYEYPLPDLNWRSLAENQKS